MIWIAHEIYYVRYFQFNASHLLSYYSTKE